MGGQDMICLFHNTEAQSREKKTKKHAESASAACLTIQ